MKLLITGANGQLGQSLSSFISTHQSIAYTRQQLDITDKQALQNKVQQDQPDVIVNCAAYTAVDNAESDPSAAELINVTAARHLAQVCQQQGIILIHVSTDYVFDGNNQQAYQETDIPNPQTVYGKTKLAGEQAIAACCEKFIILRTSWVFGATGNNFVKTMLTLFQQREQLAIVNDQHGCPTDTRHLSEVIIRIIDRLEQQAAAPWGIYHYCDTSTTTWYHFAQEIYRHAKCVNSQLNCQLTPISSQDYPTPAIRPNYSTLDCKKLHANFGIQQYSWRISLPAAIEATYATV